VWESIGARSERSRYHDCCCFFSRPLEIVRCGRCEEETRSNRSTPVSAAGHLPVLLYPDPGPVPGPLL
jgi:hypothetical protein